MSSNVKIDLAAFKRLQARLRSMHVKVGLLNSRGAGEQHPNSDLSILEIGLIHEFGTRNTPERSFLRRTFIEKRPEVEAEIKQLTFNVMHGLMTMNRAMTELGEMGEGLVREKILEGDIPPPLSPITVRIKGHDRTLVETFTLANAIAHEIVS